ncbi:MAG: M48 family metallopeptidase [Saprospiraceae bacterium]|nr:M48 family metallopeptidase [Saprospiraceae bacterium]
MAKSRLIDPIVMEDYVVPVILHKEFRRSIRFSITKKGLVIRCPVLTPSREILKNAKTWCLKLKGNKPAALAEFKYSDYFNVKELNFLNDRYHISVTTIPTDKDRISWEEKKIKVIISDQYDSGQASKSIRELITTFAVRRYTPFIKERVNQINRQHFNVVINNVRLKNNRTNWGSCSSKGNINLSVRLLKAPMKVLDYVIIHELAHRIEMNHSSRFWNIVAKACPDYKTSEKWLKEHSHLCYI